MSDFHFSTHNYNRMLFSLMNYSENSTWIIAHLNQYKGRDSIFNEAQTEWLSPILQEWLPVKFSSSNK